MQRKRQTLHTEKANVSPHIAYRECRTVANGIVNLILPHLHNILSAIDDEPLAIVVVESYV